MVTTRIRAGFAGTAALAAAGALAAGLVLLPAPGAQAFIDDWGWTSWGAWQMEMQRESISAQEEAARVPLREKRQDEVEKQEEKAAAEHDAYFAAVLEASRAALKAPAGAYYRIPGYLSADPPGSAAKAVTAGGVSYIFDQGIFWLQQGAQYLVVTAPVGAVVDAVPAGAVKVPSGKGTLWYYFGAFLAEKGGAYEVVRPPAGTAVFYLPEGYTQVNVKGSALFKFGDTYFQPVFIQGVLFYKVAEV